MGADQGVVPAPDHSAHGDGPDPDDDLPVRFLRHHRLDAHLLCEEGNVRDEVARVQRGHHVRLCRRPAAVRCSPTASDVAQRRAVRVLAAIFAGIYPFMDAPALSSPSASSWSPWPRRS